MVSTSHGKGFNLIELLIVLVMIGILGVIAVQGAPLWAGPTR